MNGVPFDWKTAGDDECLASHLGTALEEIGDAIKRAEALVGDCRMDPAALDTLRVNLRDLAATADEIASARAGGTAVWRRWIAMEATANPSGFLAENFGYKKADQIAFVLKRTAG